MTTLEDIDTVKRALLTDDTGASDALARIVDRLVGASEEHAIAFKAGGDALANFKLTKEGKQIAITQRDDTAFVSGYIVADLQGRWSQWYRERSILPAPSFGLAPCAGCFFAAEHIGALHESIMGSNPEGWAATGDLLSANEWAKQITALMGQWPKAST